MAKINLSVSAPLINKSKRYIDEIYNPLIKAQNKYHRVEVPKLFGLMTDIKTVQTHYRELMRFFNKVSVPGLSVTNNPDEHARVSVNGGIFNLIKFLSELPAKSHNIELSDSEYLALKRFDQVNISKVIENMSTLKLNAMLTEATKD